jgi:hypothetical protein
MSKLNLVDNYIKERKKNKTDDLLTMILISAKLLGTSLRKVGSTSVGLSPGYNTYGLNNQEYGYYYITRCASEKEFNAHILNGNQVSNLSFTGKNPPSRNINDSSSIPKIIEKIKNLYIDLKSNDDTHYYYDIGFSDHTFLIVKYKNNFRIVQSWMLKYQLENIVFDNDIHYSFPRFITLLFIFQYYKCMEKSIDILYIIKEVFSCSNLEARQYLTEFKKIFIMIFSKELHINGQTFNLHLEKGSEDGLCPYLDNKTITIIKYEFNPDNILRKYNTTLQNTIASLSNYPTVETWYRAKMGVTYPFYDVVNPQVNINDNIAQIINYYIYPYLSRDHDFDSIILNYIIKNYNIKLDSKSILEKLLALADIKNKRDIELVKMQHTVIQNKDKTVLTIYKNVGMEQFGGDGNNMLILKPVETFENIQYNLENLKSLNDKKQIKEDTKLSNLKKLDLLSELIKIEKNDEYSNPKLLMNNLQDNIINNIIFDPFNKIDLMTKLDTANITLATRMYNAIKDSVIKLINSHVKITFGTLLSKLNVSEQLVLIIRLYLKNTNLRPILIEFINKSKREVYDFISEIFTYDIIDNFYGLSYSKQTSLLKEFDIIDCINKNEQIILKVLNKIKFNLPNEMEQITIFQNEINDINNNNVSDKIITNYVLPIISSSTESHKLKTLMAIKIYTKSESGVDYLNTVLDNEIMFFGKK